MIRADMEVPVSGDHVALDTVDHPGRLEQAHHLMVEMDRTRQGVVFQFPFENEDLQPFQAEKVRGQRAHRAAAYDNDVVRHDFRPC
ncbi:hypothetical protein GCM10017612_44450 [Novosphingobium resinovorum]|nr:hypothetical protein GCM10017612_44450 [Novosphingobium resinovorum]